MPDEQTIMLTARELKKILMENMAYTLMHTMDVLHEAEPHKTQTANKWINPTIFLLEAECQS